MKETGLAEKTNELIENVYNWDVVNDGNIESIKSELKDMDKQSLERMSIVLESEDSILKESDTVTIFLTSISIVLAMVVMAITVVSEPTTMGKGFRLVMALSTLLWIAISGIILLRKKLPAYRRKNNKIICTKIAVKELYDEKVEKENKEIKLEKEQRYREGEEQRKIEIERKLEKLEKILKNRIKEEVKEEIKNRGRIEIKEEEEIIEEVEEKLKEKIEEAIEQEDDRSKYNDIVNDEVTSYKWGM